MNEVTGSNGGNIEFWPGNYGPANEHKIPGYGCMQVHNGKDQQTVFAFNRWNSGTLDELFF